MSAALSKMFRRSLGPVLDQVANAAEAESTAASASDTEAAAARVTSSPVKGWIRSNVLPSAASCGLLSMMS
jgi:hypothetical protein